MDQGMLMCAERRCRRPPARSQVILSLNDSMPPRFPVVNCKLISDELLFILSLRHPHTALQTMEECGLKDIHVLFLSFRSHVLHFTLTWLKPINAAHSLHDLFVAISQFVERLVQGSEVADMLTCGGPFRWNASISYIVA